MDRSLGLWHAQMPPAPARHPETRPRQRARLCTDRHGGWMDRVYQVCWDSGVCSTHNFNYHEAFFVLFMAFQRGVCAWPLTKIESITFCTSLGGIRSWVSFLVNQGCMQVCCAIKCRVRWCNMTQVPRSDNISDYSPEVSIPFTQRISVRKWGTTALIQ